MVDQATALTALGRVDDAIESYDAALAHEMRFPSLLTQAYLELPYRTGTRGIRSQYGRAVELLNGHKERLTFPLEYFRWHAARAPIAAEMAEPAASQLHAQIEHSGLPYHAAAGLVKNAGQHIDE